MTFRIDPDTALVECDTADEAVELARILRGQPKPRYTLAPKITVANGAKRSGLYEERRILAIAHLKKVALPMGRSELCRQCGFKPNNMTPVFDDPRFVITNDNLIWLAEVPDPRPCEDDEDDDGDEDVEADEPDDGEPSELDDDTDVEDEPADEPESPAHFDGSLAVKPKLLEALSQHADGLDVNQLAEITGLHKDRVRAGLVNHRGKSFSRDEAGIWTLLDKPIGEASVKPSTKAPTDKTKWQHMVATLLKSDQPLGLAEIASITKIPQAELFKILADETLFERDTDKMYWLAK